MSRGRSKTIAGVAVSQSNESRDGGAVRRNNEDQASASDGLYSVDSRRLEPAIKGKRGTTNRAVGFALAERQAERRTRSSTRVLLVDVAGRIRQGPSRCAQSQNSVTRPTRVGPPIVHPSRRGLILLQLFKVTWKSLRDDSARRYTSNGIQSDGLRMGEVQISVPCAVFYGSDMCRSVKDILTSVELEECL